MNDDQSRHVAASPDDYTITIDDAAVRYEYAGHPRTTRTIQRYCAKGHLECLRQETSFGEKYLITATSLARHIAQIEELASATSRDTSRRAATNVARQDRRESEAHDAPTGPDKSRLVAAAEIESSRYVARLEGEVEFLRGQVGTKDEQIKELTERSRETNMLVGGLQRMLAPLLGSPDPHPPITVNHDDRPEVGAKP
jgi:prophage DNA circulation protein